MNLAEIRKKAGNAKQTVADSAAAPSQPVDFCTEFPGLELETMAESQDFFAAMTENEGFSVLPEVPPEHEAPSLADAPLTAAEPEECPETTIEKRVPSYEAPLAAAAEMSVSQATVSGATHLRTAYNPLATILAGREEAVDPGEASDFLQQSLFSGNIEEYLCFRVADEEYALNIMSIKEIIKPRDVTEVPRMPNFISGVISLRGVIIPVMDMRLRLSLPVRGATGRERIIVLKTEAGFCGVLVDEVVQVARIRGTDIEEPPAVLDEIDRDFVKGLGHYDNRMLILLNLETITDITIH